MQQSDLEGIQRSGATARTKGRSYYDNPHFFDPIPAGDDGLDRWAEVCGLWANGWIEADAGRDKALAHMLRRRYW